MREDHRVVDHEWVFFVLINEIAYKVGADLGTIFAIGEILFHTVELQLRIHESAVDGLAILF